MQHLILSSYHTRDRARCRDRRLYPDEMSAGAVLLGDAQAPAPRFRIANLRGLFSRAEQDVVLATLEKSVVYVTSETIEPLLMDHDYDSSAWDLANLYLGSLGADLLGKEAPRIVGLSESTTCYMSPAYFAEDDPFADFIVHEAAHIFHNCKRRRIGLRETRTKEWLLEIEFRQRETFAYSCEAYARVLARAKTPGERRELAAEYGATVRISEERVDPAEVASIVAEAANARNGWKVILGRCAPIMKPRTALQLAREALAARDLSPRRSVTNHDGDGRYKDREHHRTRDRDPRAADQERQATTSKAITTMQNVTTIHTRRG